MRKTTAADPRPTPARASAARSTPPRRWIVLTLVAAAAGCGRPGEEDVQKLWWDAQASLHEHRIDDAERTLAQISRSRPPRPDDWMLRAQVDIARERPDEALAALAEIPDSSPIAPQARLLAGQVELRRDRARFAEKQLLEAARLDPRMVQARRELIYLYGVQLRRREFSEQFAAMSEVSNLTYENLFHWCLLRNCLWEPGEVAQTLTRFIEADPDDRESRLALADNERRLGLYDEAEEALAPLGDDDPRAMAHRVMILMDRREEDRAEELLRKGPPDDPELARLRGRVALARRDGPEALRYYQIAYKADPSNRDAVFGLIHAYDLTGQPEKAAPLRKEAEALEAFNSLVQKMATPAGRNDPAIIAQAARVCAQAGFIPEARAWLKFPITRDPLDAEAQRSLFLFDEQHPRPAHAASATHQ